MLFSFIELMQETKQSPGAETAHDCFISIQYVINVIWELQVDHDMVYHTITILQLLPDPASFLGSVLSLVESSALNTNILAISAQSWEDNSANMNF